MGNNLVRFKKLSAEATSPTRGSEFAAGADLRALINSPITLSPNETRLIPTGIAVEIPTGFVGLICARSGIATKRGLAPANKVGVIDSDYRGEIMVALHNHNPADAVVEPNERIAQLLIMPVMLPDFLEVDELDTTERGAGGFGSTGTK